MVSSTGTLMKRLSTSVDAMTPFEGEAAMDCRNSVDDLRQCLSRTYSVRILLRAYHNFCKSDREAN